MAPDQRYCVECGQRRGPAQLPFLEQAAQRTREASPPAKQRRRPAMSVNTTLIAGIGTLMLAMGTGVLIGRSATSASGNTGGVQVLTVPSSGGTAPSGGTGAAGTTSAGESESSTHTSESGEAKAKAGKGGGSKSKSAKSSASASKSTPSKLPKPEKTVVKIGSKGKGPGYQKGEFTGHFFGEEGEEEEGEEAEAEGKGKG